jgi:AcrR family transcriptional regulator
MSLDRRRVPIQERAKTRVERILGATMELLLEQGVGAVTTARIAERANVPVGSVYQYFPNKKAIFVALYKETFERMHAVLEQFEKSGPYEAGREVYLAQLADAMREAQKVGSGLDAIRTACQAYPELQEYELQQVDVSVETMVRILRRLGSRWPKAKLRRLVRYIQCLNDAGLRYRRQFNPPVAEIGEWSTYLALQTFRLCFEDALDQRTDRRGQSAGRAQSPRKSGSRFSRNA